MQSVCCYDQTIVDCVDEEEEQEEKKKTDCTRCGNSWHHKHADEETTRKPGKKKATLVCVCVIEDTVRRKERERESNRHTKERQKTQWNSMFESVEAFRLRRIFQFLLFTLSFSFLFFLICSCITKTLERR